jgi:hypothetical protein
MLFLVVFVDTNDSCKITLIKAPRKPVISWWFVSTLRLKKRRLACNYGFILVDTKLKISTKLRALTNNIFV